MSGGRELRFPCRWEFRLFVYGGAWDGVTSGVRDLDAAESAGFTLTEGEKSPGGKFRTLRVECAVPSLERARELAAKMAALPGVKFMV